jgi:hypothetical protein
MLLAIDIGLKAGFALFDQKGKLLRYGSHNFGAVARLKRAAWTMLREPEGISHLILEGGGSLAQVWLRAAEKQDIAVRVVSAEMWRKDLLWIREQRSGVQAKANADDLARAVISWSGLSEPKNLRHDAAEAILVGFWGGLQLGWLNESDIRILR